MADKEYPAVVEKIIRDGRHGPYAVARSAMLEGTVTISLNPETWGEESWKEKDWPEPGTYVVLSRIRKKRAGWRAQRAHFVDPSDNN